MAVQIGDLLLERVDYRAAILLNVYDRFGRMVCKFDEADAGGPGVVREKADSGVRCCRPSYKCLNVP